MEIDSENTRLLGPVEAPPLPTSVLNQDDQEEEEQQVPPLSSYCISAMHWAKQFRYPIFVVVGNLVSLVLTKGLFADVVDDMGRLREDVRHNLGTPDGSEFRSVQMMITVAFAISLFTFLADSYVCLQGACRMERKVAEAQEQAGQQDQPEEAEENSQEDVDFVKMSRSVDTAFGCTSNVPNATFFVCLLWALFSVAVSRAVNSCSSLVRIQLTPTAEMPQKELCFEPFQYGSLASLEYEERGGERPICSLQDSPMFASLPQDVQLWIKRRGSKHTTPVFNQSHSYIHVADGTMVFRFERGESFERTFGLVVFSPRNNSAVEYLSEIGYGMNRFSASVELVGFPANPPYYGWCGIYGVRSHLILQPEVICYNGNTRQLKQFAAIKDTGGVYGWSYRDFGVSLYATEGTLWVASSSGTKLEKMGDKREIRKSLLAYDIRTMERTLAADRNVTFTEKKRTSDVEKLKLIPECRGSYLTGFWSSIVALCLVSVYLYRLEVPSCALPASLAFASIMNLVLPATWASIVMLLCVCICLYFLVARRRARSISKYVTLEMMVWALYSLFVGSTFALWEQNHDIISLFESEEFLLHFFMFWVATAISVLLNHPIFKIFGVCYGIAGVLSCGPVFNGAQYLLTTVLLFTLSLGCFRVGTLLTLYRVHVIVHVRRACLGLKRAWSAVV